MKIDKQMKIRNMKVVKTSKGIEEIHYPRYFKFEQNEPVEVPMTIGMTLINQFDFEEVKSIEEIKKSSKRKVNK